jgi:ABC-type multidrug transport system ATPase subunit
MQFYAIGRFNKLPRNASRPCLSLTADSWNDFGYSTLFTLKYFTADEEIELGQVKISNDQQPAKTKLDDEFERLPANFFSLGQSLSYYENIRKLKKDIREDILASLQDVIFHPNLYEQFGALEVFQSSLMRYSEASLVMRNAGQLFKAPAPAEQTRCSFLFEVKMKEADTPHTLSVTLGNEPRLPDRMMALIGKNGTGKTWFLGRLAAALSGDEVKVGTFEPQRPGFRNVIALSFSAFDKFNRPDSTRTFSYTYIGVYDADGNFLTRNKILAKTRMAADVVTKKKRIKLWEEMIEHSLDKETMKLMREYLFKSGNEKAALPKLSSGQRVLLSTITQLVATIEPESMVLIDEPEIHQHPNSVAGMMFALNTLLSKFESFALIATHSPLVIQQIPARYVRVFLRVGNVTVIRELRNECFGENLTAITQEVFQTNSTKSLYEEWFKQATADMNEKQLLGLFPNGLSFNALSTMESVK